MNKQINLSDTDKIFATGVFLQPVKCTINNVEQWRWVAVDFEDDSFYNGETVNLNEYAENLEDLIITESQE
ncbi:MAG: hypothetical protein ACR2HG_11375 [Pyrinomonadaceae bacterium]